MPDRPDDRDRNLERELGELGRHVEYPPTPDLARSVRSRLDGEQPAGRQRTPESSRATPRWSTAQWAVAAALVLVLVVPAVVFGGWFATGMGGSAGMAGGAGESGGVQEEGAEPGPLPTQAGDQPESGGGPGMPETAGDQAESGGGGSETPRTTSEDEAAAGATEAGVEDPAPGAGLSLGETVTLRGARDRFGSTVLTPRLEGFRRPDTVYADNLSQEGSVTLVYRASAELPSLDGTDAGAALVQFPAGSGPSYPPAAGSSTFEQTTVNDKPAYWFPDGRSLSTQPGELGSLSGGALLWERDGRTLVLRSELPLDEAVRIAASVR